MATADRISFQTGCSRPVRRIGSEFNAAHGPQQAWRLDAALREARRRLGPDVTVQRLLILLTVYQNEGLSQGELLEHLDSTSVPALSRNLADLSERTSRKTRGPGLLRLRPDPMNLRRKTVHLTAKGREVVAAILGEVGAH
jgi:DNA-binding MarR family transcriptional regulator